MNKEQLEKMFDEKFKLKQERYNIYLHEDFNDIKQFIFSTMIVEVLKSILPDMEKPKLWSENQDLYIAYANWYNKSMNDIKQKAKQLYWIDL